MRERVVEPEVMDDPALEPARHRAALAGLRRLNALSGGARAVWSCIRQLTREDPGQPLRILDIATGSGDVPIGLWALARRAGAAVEIAGCDVSTTALAYAREHAQLQGATLTFFELDALRQPLPVGYDVLTCSLFLHHLEADDALRLLTAMRIAAGRCVVINDLQRSRLNLGLVWLGSRVVTRSDVVHVDGPRSVRAALTSQEALELAHQAGLHGASARSCFPCRYLLTWSRGE